MFTPVNGAPMTLALGTDDRSIRQRVFERAPRAIHLPWQPLWTQWGPEKTTLVYGNSRELIYGGETFNINSKWANHATLFANLFASNANPMMIKRIRPDDAGPNANFRVSIDLLETRVDEISRNDDGSFKRNTGTGRYVTTGQRIRANVIKFVVEPVFDGSSVSAVGKGRQSTGDQNDSGVVSKRYPLFDFEVPHFGSFGNNFGVKMWAPTTTDAYTLNQDILTEDGAYPFRLQMVQKSTKTKTPSVIPTQNGERFLDFVLKPGLVDKTVGRKRYLGDIVLDEYQNMTPSPGFPIEHGPFGRVHIYQANVDEVLGKILALEAASEYPQNDLHGKTAAEDKYRVNLLGALNADGTPYQTVRFANATTGTVRFTEQTVMYADGGTDGTMNNATFSAKVAQELAGFNDASNEYQDILGYPCSFFWDSGYDMECKYAMFNFIAMRKNTCVVVSTHIDGEDALSGSDESARVMTLMNRARAYTDSDYFGTPAFRYCVVSRSGKLLNSSYVGRVGLSYELANMVSLLANSNRFRSAHLFDRTPNNIVTMLSDLNAPWMPARTRNVDWANGMLWAERLTQDQYYIPAARTGYKNDTSVLTSFLTAMAIAECQTVGEMAQKQFSGGNYTQGELKQFVEEYVTNELKGKFAERFTIIPEVSFSKSDIANGYSWTLTIRIYAGNMRTVQTLIIESYRADDLEADNSGFIA